MFCCCDCGHDSRIACGCYGDGVDALAVARDGADVLEQAGVTAHVESIGTIGAAWFPIIERSQSPDVAAIVVGTHARSQLRSLWLGSVSYNVIHHTTKPVLIVHAGADDRDASHCG